MRRNKLARARFEFNFYPDEESHPMYNPVELHFDLPHDCSEEDIHRYYLAFLVAMGYSPDLNSGEE